MSKQQVDWEALEKEWALDQLSNRQLAHKYEVAHTTISRRAKKYGWVKDKGSEVRRKTRAALIKSSSNAPVGGKAVKIRTTPSQEDIDGAVKDNVALIREHRTDIRRARTICNTLASQLLNVADFRETIEELILKETKGDKDKRKQKALLKAVSLSSNASTLRDLSTALKNLVPLERQAFNIDGEDDIEDPLSALLSEVRKRSKKLVNDPPDDHHKPDTQLQIEHPILGGRKK